MATTHAMWNHGETEAQVRPASPPPAVQAIAFPVLAALGRLFGQRP